VGRSLELLHLAPSSPPSGGLSSGVVCVTGKRALKEFTAGLVDQRGISYCACTFFSGALCQRFFVPRHNFGAGVPGKATSVAPHFVGSWATATSLAAAKERLPVPQGSRGQLTQKSDS